MSKSKVYYKVVTRELKSAVINSELYYLLGHHKYNAVKDFCVQYIQGEWIKPNRPGTKLMVFSDFNSARNFAFYENLDLIVYECSVRNPTKNGFITEVVNIHRYYDKLNKLIKQKKKVANFYEDCKKSDIPANTFLCSAVKLLREVSLR